MRGHRASRKKQFKRYSSFSESKTSKNYKIWVRKLGLEKNEKRQNLQKNFFSMTFLVSLIYFFLGKLLIWNFQERFFDNSRIFFKKNYLKRIDSFCAINNRNSCCEKRRQCIAIILFLKKLAWKRLKSAKNVNGTNLWPPTYFQD